MTDTLLINKILNSVLERKATDLHLVAGNNPVIRVDGRLVTLTDQDILNPETIQGIASSFLTNEEMDKLQAEKELATSYEWSNRARFRVKLFYQKGYLAISMRVVPPFIRSPKELGVPTAILQLLNKEKGLLIITGPFSSGRTTVAVSLLETLNQNKGVHIQTLEHPVEYLFSNNQSIIEQRQVGRDVISFTKGLKDMLDEDIDVVLVDDMHEEGTEELVLELAESGKLIIAIMDADSVVSALERFIKNLPTDKRAWGQEVLADNLIGALAQRLLARVGGGLAMASEVLTSTPAVKSSIRDNNLHQLNSIMQTSKDEGMTVIDKSLLELVRVGEVSMEEARNNAVNPEGFK